MLAARYGITIAPPEQETDRHDTIDALILLFSRMGLPIASPADIDTYLERLQLQKWQRMILEPALRRDRQNRVRIIAQSGEARKRGSKSLSMSILIENCRESAKQSRMTMALIFASSSGNLKFASRWQKCSFTNLTSS
jgi:hypothetical protein